MAHIHLLTKEQLEEKCRKCIKIKIDKEDINKAIKVKSNIKSLEEKLKVS